MQKKAIASLLGKNARARVFMAVPQSAFHSSKTTNIEVSIKRVKAL
jgi:hypothetical protein